MTDGNAFEISVNVDRDSVTVDSLAEQFDAVADLKAEYDSLQTSMDEMREELGLEADECPCDHVADLKAEADEADELREQLDEYRQSEKEDRLDRLSELNADRDEWEDEDLDEIEAEIDRREEIFEDIDFSVKNADGGDGEETDTSSTSKGRRRFGRGYNA
jgi:chromosome segregation ATPase